MAQPSQQHLQCVQQGWFRCGKDLGKAHKVSRLASVAQPSSQCLIRDIGPHGMTQPECIDDSTGSVIQADSVRVVQSCLGAPHVECGRGELMPLDRRGHGRLPRPARYRNVMNRRDNISQLMPGQCRQQAQRGLVCLCRDLDQVVVGWLFIGAPVQSAPDALNRAVTPVKPAPASSAANASGELCGPNPDGHNVGTSPYFFSVGQSLIGTISNPFSPRRTASRHISSRVIPVFLGSKHPSIAACFSRPFLALVWPESRPAAANPAAVVEKNARLFIEKTCYHIAVRARLRRTEAAPQADSGEKNTSICATWPLPE